MVHPTKSVTFAAIAATLAGGGFFVGLSAAPHTQSSSAARMIADFGYQSVDKSAAFEIEILAPSTAAEAPRTLHLSAATTNESGYLALSSTCIPDPKGAESILAGRRWKLTVQPKPEKTWAQVKDVNDVVIDCIPFTIQPPPQKK
jgi:hypothetical protein